MAKDFPLVIFTLLQQMATGGFIILALLLLTKAIDQNNRLQLSKRLLVIVILSGLALMTSTLHLGHPFRGPNVLFGLGRSWLSNEVIITGLFFGSVASYWLMSWRFPEWANLKQLSLIVGLLSGLAGLSAMSLTYMIYTVPVWDTWHTAASFFTTALTAGALLALLISQSLAGEKPTQFIHLVGLIGLISCALVMAMQAQYWGGVSSAVTTPVEQFPGYASWMLTRAALLLLAALVWLAVLITRKTSSFVIFLTLALVLIAEGMGRVVFYGVHMTAGL
ncbi:dimethyl sulfoxide reductase anchor subunit family protein [Marinospirillum insulare]|uniref:Dimethyl sulfoxide reductase subunit C n=1 Tax=Marinospirillum insulare TaxID=217169 RepID=A0ABQ5ZTI3_9GAMM|nr:DmsC/YnfH family molybdoenzyme membrane anchor subunit [Marinospirillum insulare]GLR62732.1 dimethyl sulfoxide reductase subunit C [Marinospirillum insulare]